MNDYQQIHLDPPLTQWTGLLNSGTANSWPAEISDLRSAARRRLVQSAESFVLRLHDLARNAGLPANQQPLLTGDPSQQPILMTGHQPVIFHSGLTFKYRTAEELAAEARAIAVAVVIDTDEGDAGHFRFPAVQPDQSTAQPAGSNDLCLTSLEASISPAAGMLAHAKLKTSSELQAQGADVAAALTTVGETAAADRVKTVFRDYARLADGAASAMEANLILRWLHGIGGQLLELPLSAVAAFPEVLTLICDVIRQAPEFAAVYNRELAAYRRQHHIRNAANPFPDLDLSEDLIELPFWLVNHRQRSRHSLQVQVRDGQQILQADGRIIPELNAPLTPELLQQAMLQDLQIIPRAALITAVLRLLFSDLFVHGTGGARYDHLTDRLIQAWWQVPPTPFTIASASRYLFADQRRELQRLQTVQTDLRDLQHNPQRHFDGGVFTPEFQQQLSTLIQAKQAAVERLKQAQSRNEPAKDLGREIQQISDQIKQSVTAQFQPQLDKLKALSPEHRHAIEDRTYPWFMFET